MTSNEQRNLMGAYIRQQRRIADMSMRQVSSLVGISNPYLSQIERGLRAPSEAVAAGIATALGVSVDDLYPTADAPSQEHGEDDRGPASTTRRTDLLRAIEQATELTPAQRVSLAEIYRSFVRSNANDEQASTADDADDASAEDG